MTRLFVGLLLLTQVAWAEPDEVRLRIYEVDSPNQSVVSLRATVRVVKEPGEPLPSRAEVMPILQVAPEEVVWRRQGDFYVSEHAEPLPVEDVQALRDALLTWMDLDQMLVALGMTSERIEALRAGVQARLGSAPSAQDLREIVRPLFQKRTHGAMTGVVVTLPGLCARAAGDSFGSPLTLPWLSPGLAPNYNPAICAAMERLTRRIRGFYPFHQVKLTTEDWENLWVRQCPDVLSRLVLARPGWEKARDRFYAEPDTNLSLRPVRGPIDHLDCVEVVVRRGLPQGNWQDALDLLNAQERLLATQPWLVAWKAARFGRRLRVLVRRDGETSVSLCEPDNHFGRATGFFKSDGSFEILTVAGPKTGHWFDQLQPGLLVICKPDGSRQLKPTEVLE